MRCIWCKYSCAILFIFIDFTVLNDNSLSSIAKTNRNSFFVSFLVQFQRKETDVECVALNIFLNYWHIFLSFNWQTKQKKLRGSLVIKNIIFNDGCFWKCITMLCIYCESVFLKKTTICVTFSVELVYIYIL